MMHFVQDSSRPESYEVMAAAYAMATGLGDVERAADAYAREPDAALDLLRDVCKETQRETLDFAEAIWTIHQILSAPESGLMLRLSPFEKMLGEIRESEARLDRGMAQHEIIREIMMPLRRATAKARANVSYVVGTIRQQQPGKSTVVPPKADPEGLRTLAAMNTRLLHEKFG